MLPATTAEWIAGEGFPCRRRISLWPAVTPTPMNPTPTQPSTPPPDPALSDLLRSWKVDGSLPEGFAREVQQRIARDQAPLKRATVGWLSALLQALSPLQRPAFAIAYVTAGIVLGGLSGSRHAQSRPSPPPSDPQVRYIASIDPYQMPRHVNP